MFRKRSWVMQRSFSCTLLKNNSKKMSNDYLKRTPASENNTGGVEHE